MTYNLEILFKSGSHDSFHAESGPVFAGLLQKIVILLTYEGLFEGMFDAVNEESAFAGKKRARHWKPSNVLPLQIYLEPSGETLLINTFNNIQKRILCQSNNLPLGDFLCSTVIKNFYRRP